jgi:hypothetical protein
MASDSTGLALRRLTLRIGNLDPEGSGQQASGAYKGWVVGFDPRHVGRHMAMSSASCS